MFKSVIEALECPGPWPLDTIVKIGTIFGGPSQNDSSSPAHINFQNLSNSSKKNENEIRDLCAKTFQKYAWKIKKVGFDSEHIRSSLLVFELIVYIKPKQEVLPEMAKMTSEEYTEPYSNAALETMFAYIRLVEDGRHGFQRMLSLSTSMCNRTCETWLRFHPEWQKIIIEVLKSRETTKVGLFTGKILYLQNLILQFL